MRVPVPAPTDGSWTFDATAIGLNAVDLVVVVAEYPAHGSKVEIRSRQILFGGQAATAMVSLSRLGFRTQYVGRVGSDDEGRLQLESIIAEGVDCSECRVVEGVRSQMSIIIVDEHTGERTVMWGRDDRVAVLPAELDRERIESSRTLHVDGHNIAAEVLAASWARARGIPVTIDVDKDYGGGDLYPLVDYLLASEEFPERITGIADPRNALQAVHERFGNPVIAMTLGSRGSLALCDGRFIETPAFVVDVKDTTGAGDAFHAGFLYGLLTGRDLDDCLVAANAVAAMNCTRIGARGGLPTRRELEDFLAGAR